MDFTKFNRLLVSIVPFNLDEAVRVGAVKTPYEHLVSEEKFPCSYLVPREQNFVFIPFTEIEGTVIEMLQKENLRPVTEAEFLAVCRDLTTKDPKRFLKNAPPIF